MKRDLELLYEIGSFRYVERTWKHFLGADFANNAEHSFKVAWMALMIAHYEGEKDSEKILKIALMHDIIESRTGDTNYLSRQYVVQDENMALEDVFKGTPLLTEMRELWREYKERKSLASKIVKDADNLDVDMELMEQRSKGNMLGTHWLSHRKLGVYPKLYTKTAKRMWKEIWNSNPHDWHLNARNRFNGGDWKTDRKKSKKK